MPDSCYRRNGFSVNDSEESVYGDQGQEVAWEVWQDRFDTRRQQEEIEEHEVPQPVRVCQRWKQRSERVDSTSEHVGEEWFELEAKRRDGVFS